MHAGLTETDVAGQRYSNNTIKHQILIFKNFHRSLPTVVRAQNDISNITDRYKVIIYTSAAIDISGAKYCLLKRVSDICCFRIVILSPYNCSQTSMEAFNISNNNVTRDYNYDVHCLPAGAIIATGVVTSLA